MTRTRATALAALVAVSTALAGGSVASASLKVGADARRPALRVTAKGLAEVGWTTTAGVRRFAVVAPSGRITWGRRLTGRNVAVRTRAVRLPLRAIVRRAPDGSFWALQSWRRLKRGPIELRVSHWRGKPTLLTLRAVRCGRRCEKIQGYASFHGRPVFGFKATQQGVPLDEFGRNVYLDTYRAGGWRRMMGILTHRPTGFFRLWIRPHWLGRSYRGAMIGPNWGWALAPDARAYARSSLR